MTEIFTAKTVEEAKELAAAKFGKKISEIDFEIVDEGKKGFLGIGKSDAKLKATVKEKSSDVSAKAVDTAVKQTVQKTPVSNEVKIEKKTEAAPVKIEKTEAPAKTQEVKRVPSNKDSDEDEYSIDNYTLVEDQALVNPKVKIAQDYMTSIFNALGVKAEYTVYQNETGAVINIESDSNGTIIGRRGETLDAIQYLCSIIANKGDKDYFRLTVDCFGYRKKRKETLEQLALKVAKSVLRTGRSQPLEPMNPYERRVIHSAVSKIDGVSSRSVGEEPYRKIVISSTTPRRAGGNGNNGGKRRFDNNGPHKPNGNRNHHANNKPAEPFESKAIDLSTSFEKDYKKPKPEDNIEGGLYGKIEF